MTTKTPPSIAGKERADLGVLSRSYAVRMEDVDEEKRTIALSFSSEAPVSRWFGEEILDHSPESVRLDRIRAGGPLLWQHNPNDQIGVVEEVSLGADRMGRAVVRLGGTPRAEEFFGEIRSGVIKNVSVGYAVHGMKLEEEREGAEPVYRVDDWEPIEISFVSIPADTTVGVGRSEDFLGKTVETRIYQPQKRQEAPKRTVTTKTTDPPADPAPAPAPTPRKADPDEKRSWQESQKRLLADMRALAKEHADKIENAEGIALDYFEQGRSLDELGSRFLELHRDAKPLPEGGGMVGLTDKEKKRWSFARVLDALTNPGDRRKWEAAAFEREVSEAAAQIDGKEARGFKVPLDVLTFTGRFGQAAMQRLAKNLGVSTRDLTVGSATAGGNTVGTDIMGASFIDVLRASNPVLMDCTMLTGLNGDVAIPRHSAATAAYWVAESGSPTEGAPTFDQVTMSPETVGAYLDLSRRLRIQSSIDIEEFALMDIAFSLGIELGRVIIEGSGSSNQPTGILNQSGIGDVADAGGNGSAPDWDDIVAIIAEVDTDNALRGDPEWYLNANGFAKLMATERSSGSGYFILDADRGSRTMGGYGYKKTNLVPNDLTAGSGTNLSALLFGVMSDALCGLWSGIDIIVDEASLSTQGALRVVGLQDADVAVRHAQSFAAKQDAITTL